MRIKAIIDLSPEDLYELSKEEKLAFIQTIDSEVAECDFTLMLIARLIEGLLHDMEKKDLSDDLNRMLCKTSKFNTKE